MMSVTFTKTATVVKLQNPDLGDGLKVDLGQGVQKRSDGDYFRFALATAASYDRELTFSFLRRAERDALLSFFVTSVQGVLLDFTFTDERGTQWTAHFLEGVLEFKTVQDATASSTTYKITGGEEEFAYPTTTRNDGHYSVTFRLHLKAIA